MALDDTRVQRLLVDVLLCSQFRAYIYIHSKVHRSTSKQYLQQPEFYYYVSLHDN